QEHDAPGGLQAIDDEGKGWCSSANVFHVAPSPNAVDSVASRLCRKPILAADCPFVAILEAETIAGEELSTRLLLDSVVNQHVALADNVFGLAASIREAGCFDSLSQGDVITAKGKGCHEGGILDDNLTEVMPFGTTQNENTNPAGFAARGLLTIVIAL